MGCGGTTSLLAEPIAQTFARVPGKDAPNLFASIVGILISKRYEKGKFEIAFEGSLEIAIIACGPRIIVPVGREDKIKNGSSYDFNRISLSFSVDKKLARLVLVGTPTKPETYRIAGLDEVVLLVVPFKSTDGLKLEKTQSTASIEGEYALGSYSAVNNVYTVSTKRDIVPAGHPPVPVIDSSK